MLCKLSMLSWAALARGGGWAASVIEVALCHDGNEALLPHQVMIIMLQLNQSSVDILGWARGAADVSVEPSGA